MSHLRATALALILAAVAFQAAGCAYGELRHVLRAQFAAEHDCTEVKMVKRALWYASDGPDQYKISGCGVMRTYTCPKPDGLVSYDEPQCTWVEGDADAPEMASPSSGGEDLDDAADDELGEQSEDDEYGLGEEADAEDEDADEDEDE